MSIIHLDKSVYELIAAGEVIDRPAAVVRELLDNSIDAQATKIRVNVSSGGMKKIEVIDNGFGMSSDDLKICFLKHTTSKIKSFNDIYTVSSLGFRGEAINSIALISHLEIITKQENDEIASKIRVEAGELIEESSCSRTTGTTTRVENLFYNVPARRKFIKSHQAEFRKIHEEFLVKSLPYKEIAFELYNSNLQIVSTPQVENLKDRIGIYYTEELKDNLVELDTSSIKEEDEIFVEGFITKPGYTRNNRREQLFYLNGRPIVSQLLYGAVKKAYEHIIPGGKFPAVFIFMTINPADIDINIHPAKKEVKFHNESEVFRSIYHSIGETINKHHLSHENTFDNTVPSVKTGDNKNSIKKAIKEHYESKPKQSGLGLTFNKNAFPKTYPKNQDYQWNNRTDKEERVERLEPFEKEEKQYRSPAISEYKVIGAVFDSYIILEKDEHMLVMDQHAVHERINYEKLKKSISEKSINSQNLLQPFYFELSEIDHEKLIPHLESFEELGFSLKLADNKKIVCTSVPYFVEEGKIKSALQKVIDLFLEKDEVPSKFVVLDRIIKSQSCRHSIMSGDRLSKNEIYSLLDEILSYENPFTCPHGRPSVVKVKRQEIEKWFLRN